MASSRQFHDAIVYVDESGDHGPVSKEYPVFVLAFCLFDKERYAEDFTTAMQKMKFKYFGHDVMVFHEREIRKAKGPFNILLDASVRQSFMNDVNQLVAEADFTLIAAAIRKDALRDRDAWPENPYHLAMKFGLERVAKHYGLKEDGPTLHVVFESRGKKEDSALELAFRRFCDADGNVLKHRLPMRLVFGGKQGNYLGLELADQVARPIGRHVLKPDQANRAYDVIETRFRQGPRGEIDGWGLKCFP
ncbi:MAG: DUF3800 domain-containing protein [Deltaproteobacteria bacterium]|nr:DUF3800 domain-containing protein [Deltaproteobacteria bacterium]